jgi:MFS family permease
MDAIAVEVAKTKKAPLLSGLMLLFLFAMILANLGGNMYGPLMSLYVKDLGASVEQIGLFFTLSSIIPLLLQILGGYISDTLGRLRAIAIGSVVGIFTYLALILAPTWQWLILATAFAAVAGSLVGPSFDAFIAENSSEENRAKTFGVSQALFAIVGVVGPATGGFLANNYGFKFMMMIGGCLYVVATIIRVSMARVAAKKAASTHPAKLSFSSLKENLGTMFGLLVAGGVITWVLVTDGVRDISFALSMNFLTVYMQDFAHLDLTQIGFTSSVFGLMMMSAMIPGGWLADKAGERVGIALGFFLVSISLAMLVFLPIGPVWQYAVGWGIAGLGVGTLQPAYMSLISKAVPQKVRGTAFGLFSSSIGLVSLPAPMIGGWLWQQVNPRFPFVITIVVCFLSIIPVWLKFKLPKVVSESNGN